MVVRHVWLTQSGVVHKGAIIVRIIYALEKTIYGFEVISAE